MILYDKYVNYSVFDGEITLSADAKDYLLNTVFSGLNQNLDITLIIRGNKFKARLMNVSSSASVQIKYGTDGMVKE